MRAIKRGPCICGNEGTFHLDWSTNPDSCYIQCNRCGRRTKNVSMPWIAWEEEWNKHKYLDEGQMTIFDYEGRAK